MRFTPSFLDEIRTRLPVSAVVGRCVKLKKQGREWRGLSPFNAEKTPSFYVNDQKGFYHDFSSGKHGDQFTFVMETEGLSFPEAVERLAGEAGVPMPLVSADEIKREEARRSLTDVMELATAYFEQTLQGRSGAHARGYLARRELSPETWAEFRVGYATSERFGLRDHLAAKGVSREDMIATGLLVHGEDIEVPYDRFRDRVLFPIQDMRGRVVAFGGRALSSDVAAKYLNSPETELFHKGSMLFNGHRARKAAHATDRLVIVEGYVDVVALAQAGIAEAVAPLGTAMTEEQLDLAWRMVPEPILCFDGDKAGLRAAHRAIDIALPKIGAEKTVRFAFLPSGMDPDDLVRARGRAAMEEVLATSRSLVDVLWERETAQADLSTPERRARLERRLREVVGAIADGSLKFHYEDDVRSRLKALFRPVSVDTGRRDAPSGGGGGWRGRGDGRGRFARGAPPVTESEGLKRSRLGLAARKGAGASASAADASREAMMLLLMANHPSLLERHLEAFDALEIDDRELSALKDDLVAALLGGARDGTDMAADVRARGRSGLLERLTRAAMASGIWPVLSSAAPEDAETTWSQMVALHRRARTLHRDLKAAESAFGDDPSEDNDSRLRAIRLELLSAEGTEALIEGYGAMSGRAPRAS